MNVKSILKRSIRIKDKNSKIDKKGRDYKPIKSLPIFKDIKCINTSLPKIIHQTWKNEKIPDNVKCYQQSWFDHHPKWEYKLWTDKTCRELVEQKYPRYLKLYNSFEQNIQRVDFWKYLAIHQYGGVYADLDCEAVKPLDPLVERRKKDRFIILGKTDGRTECAFMISTPKHPFWMKLCDYIADCYHNQSIWLRGISACTSLGVLWTTGPFILTDYIKNYRRKEWNISIKPDTYFFPKSWLDRKKNGSNWSIKSYVVHHYTDTWLSSWEKQILDVITDYWILAIVIIVLVVVFVILFFVLRYYSYL